jgi:hypothetical protein
MIRQREIQPWLGFYLLLGALVTLSPLHTLAAEAPQPPQGLATPDQATSMPVFELPAVNADTVRSEALRGKVVVIRFWASW